MAGRFKKSLWLFLTFFLFLPISIAIEECQGTVTQDEIPCYVLLPLSQPSGNCSVYNVSFYNTSTFIYSEVLDSYNTFNCNATFNDSRLGTYSFEFGTGDTGSIIVTKGYNMFWVILSITAFLLLILGLSIAYPDTTATSLSSIGLMVVGVYVLINGMSIANNIMTIGFGSVLLCIGFYSIFKAHYEDWVGYGI